MTLKELKEKIVEELTSFAKNSNEDYKKRIYDNVNKYVGMIELLERIKNDSCLLYSIRNDSKFEEAIVILEKKGYVIEKNQHDNHTHLTINALERTCEFIEIPTDVKVDLISRNTLQCIM